MVPCRIPWRDIIAWADYHGMSEDDTSFLDHCIRAMDDVYLEHWRNTQPSMTSRAKG